MLLVDKLQAQSMSQLTAFLTFLLILDIRHSAVWLRASTGHWIPNEPAEIQLGIHCQKETWSAPQALFKHTGTFKKGAQVSAPPNRWSLVSVMTLHQIWIPGLHFWAQQKWFKVKWAAHRVPQPAGAFELHMCNVAFTHTNARTDGWTFNHHHPNMRRCTQAQKHKLTASYTSTLCSQKSPAKRACRGRCSDAETGAIHRASCSLPGNYHIKLERLKVLTGTRRSHYSLLETGMTLLDYDYALTIVLLWWFRPHQ